MQITGTQALAAPPQEVWEALNDPAVLQRCLPGCEHVERASADTFRVAMKAAVGPLRARFRGTLRMADADPPRGCTMVFDGEGGAAGFGKGTSSVTLAPDAAGTRLSYTAQAQLGGKLAQVGSRLIDGVARRMADDFFDALRRQLAGDPDAAGAATDRPPDEGDGPAGRGVGPGVGAGDALARPASAPVPLAGEPVPSEQVVASRPPHPTGTEAPATATVPTVAVALAAPVASVAPVAPVAPVAGPAMVPGWWLAVAALLGCATTLAGALLLR